jgi:hypothetical protein
MWYVSLQDLTPRHFPIAWFFERFGWLNPPVETIARDQGKLLSGRF